MKFSKLNYSTCFGRENCFTVPPTGPSAIDDGMTVQFFSSPRPETWTAAATVVGKVDELFVVLYVTVSNNEQHLEFVFFIDEVVLLHPDHRSTLTAAAWCGPFGGGASWQEFWKCTHSSWPTSLDVWLMWLLTLSPSENICGHHRCYSQVDPSRGSQGNRLTLGQCFTNIWWRRIERLA